MRLAGFILPLLLLVGAGSAGCDARKARASPCTLRPGAAQAASSTSLPVPPLTGRVVDMANILSPQAEAELTERSAELERRTRDQLVIVTTADLHGQPIETYGLTLGNAWGIGRKDLDNGVLLIIAPQNRRVRIDVGCGLEGLLTDARAAGIVDAALLPSLKKGEYEAAAKAGAGGIIQILESDTRRPQRRPERTQG